MPRQKARNWTKIGVLVGIFLSVLAMSVAIIVSNLDIRDKQIGLIVLAFLGYIVYNEVTKAHVR